MMNALNCLIQKLVFYCKLNHVELTTSYHRQRETIITWLDELSQLDLAISFQELEGAQETWEVI